MGGNRRKDHPKRGTAPRPPGQRLAKRKARKEQLVKFSLCPIPSECSTAYRVRKFAKGPARVLVGAALIGQNGLEPRPAAREGAPRPEPPRDRHFLSRPPRRCLFGAPHRKWGWTARRASPAPPVGRPASTAGCGHPALRGARGRHAGVVVPYGRQLPLHKGAFGTGCCGSLQSSPNSRRNSASSSASLSSRAWVPARDSMWWVSSWARVSRSSRRQSSSVQSSCSARAAKDP